MAKNCTILTVSVPKDQSSFLDDHNLSPSELLQRSIAEQMDLWTKYHTEIGKIVKSNEQLLKLQTDLFEFIEEMGKTDEFLKWRGEKHHAMV
jgi:hypothetical protein